MNNAVLIVYLFEKLRKNICKYLVDHELIYRDNKIGIFYKIRSTYVRNERMWADILPSRLHTC